MSFSAIYLTQKEGVFHALQTQLEPPPLQDGQVRIAVEYSSLNYKDALALSNRSAVVRAWPMVPGIDGAGTVIESAHPRWRIGDKVFHQGWGAGESVWGCLAQQACLAGDGLLALPANMSTRYAMAIGTAGYTAMLSILALERNGVLPDSGEILVTGALGGLGSIAVALLAKLGYRVTASTAKVDEIDFLRWLGAHEVIDRALLSGPHSRPLQKARWAGVIDAVGSYTLANALAQTQYGGTVTACGLAQGIDLPTSVAPFILRSVQLVGIDSVQAPQHLREQAWQRLAVDLESAKLDALVREIPLSSAISMADQLLAGKLRGRMVVNVNT